MSDGYLINDSCVVVAQAHGAVREHPEFRFVDGDIYLEATVGSQLSWPRQFRDALLSATDFVEMPSFAAKLTSEQAAAWTAYRQTLRDMTKVFADPASVVWPIRPDGKAQVSPSILAPAPDATELAAIAASSAAAVEAERAKRRQPQAPMSPQFDTEHVPNFVPAFTIDDDARRADYQKHLDAMAEMAKASAPNGIVQ